MPAPIVCYVTDRKYFTKTRNAGSGASSAKADAREGPGDDVGVGVLGVLASIRRAIDAGVDWVQIREKDLQGRELMELVREAVQMARGGAGSGKRAKIIVNDRADVAMARGAAGVHLGRESVPAQAVVQLMRGGGSGEGDGKFLVGVSCHSLEEAREAENAGASYIHFGPVFETPSKTAFGAPHGIERLREVCGSVQIPVLAIGGIDAGNFAECLEAGAAGIAAIRLFQDQGNDRDLQNLLKNTRKGKF